MADISLAEWNANDLTKYKAELMHFLDDNKIDILFLNQKLISLKEHYSKYPITQNSIA